MKNEFLERCDLYHRGLLDQDDTDLFLLEISQDDSLKEIYNLYVSSMIAIDSNSIKHDLTSIHDKYKSRTLRRKNLLLFVSIAASILLLVCVGWFVFYHNNSHGSIDQYFTPYPDIITVRGEKAQTALDQYSNENYKAAYALLSQTEPKTAMTLLYMLNCSLANGEIEIDQSWLNLLEEYSNSSANYQQIRWYAGLYYINLQDKEKGRYFLNKIESGEYNYDQAQELLKY